MKFYLQLHGSRINAFDAGGPMVLDSAADFLTAVQEEAAEQGLRRVRKEDLEFVQVDLEDKNCPDFLKELGWREVYSVAVDRSREHLPIGYSDKEIRT